MSAQQRKTTGATRRRAKSRSVPPKWGDPISSIPIERQEQLRTLAEEQRAWVAATGLDLYPNQSPMAMAANINHPLTGLEVFFLAIESVAAKYGLDMTEAERQLHSAASSFQLMHLDFLHLEGADVSYAHLVGANLSGANLVGIRLFMAHLEGSDLSFASLEDASLSNAHLEGALLSGTSLEGASLEGAHLEGAELSEAHLEGANLYTAHLEGASFSDAHLEGAELNAAFFSAATILEGAAIADEQHGTVQIADVRWQDVNLAIIAQWHEIERLGDEQEARNLKREPLSSPDETWPPEPLPKGASHADREKAREMRRGDLLEAWRRAARANRQLASVMRDQGMNDEADHFAYRGQLCQRELYRIQGKVFRWAFSRFLDIIAGYGFKPERSLFAYLSIIFGFALAFHFIGPLQGHTFHYDGALIFSVTSFHGRGFFPGGLDLENWITRLAALEAILGLLIEISFIATFTQRFFSR